MPMNALGTTAVLTEVGTSKLRIRLTISPSRISLVTSSLLRSSSVTPFVFRCSIIRFPSASASRIVSSAMWATAVDQVIWK